MSFQANIHSAVPVVGTDDIEESLSYYIDVLGFLPDFKFGEPAVYAGVKSGEAEIYFSYDPELSRKIKTNNINPEIFIWLSDADSLYKKHLNEGVEIVEHISDRPWGARQYVVKEINGYYLKFAQPI